MTRVFKVFAVDASSPKRKRVWLADFASETDANFYMAHVREANPTWRIWARTDGAEEPAPTLWSEEVTQ